MKKSLLLALLALSLTATGCATQSNTSHLSAPRPLESAKIIVNGEELVLPNAMGKAKYPIIHDERLYLSSSTIGALLDYGVGYNAEENKLYIHTVYTDEEIQAKLKKVKTTKDYAEFLEYFKASTGLIYDKGAEKILYLSPDMQETFKEAKIGDKYKEAVPYHVFVGDSSKDSMAFLYDPCNATMWYNAYSINQKIDNKNAVLVFAVPVQKPEQILLIKQDEVADNQLPLEVQNLLKSDYILDDYHALLENSPHSYGVAYTKDNEELLYINKNLQKSLPKAKIGDIYKQAVPNYVFFGDGKVNTKGLLYDNCDEGYWYSTYTLNHTSKNGEQTVLSFMLLENAPKEIVKVK